MPFSESLEEDFALGSGLNGLCSAHPSSPIPPLRPSLKTCPVCAGESEEKKAAQTSLSDVPLGSACCACSSHFVLPGPCPQLFTALPTSSVFLILSIVSGPILALKKDKTLGAWKHQTPTPSPGTSPSFCISLQSPDPEPF